MDVKSTVRSVRTVITIGVASLLLAALGCGSGGDESSTAPPAAEAATPGTRQVVVPGTEANPKVAEVSTGELPEGYPKDLPAPPQSKPMNALLVPGQGGMVTFLSQASSDEVASHFKDALPAQGWTIDSATNDERRTMIKASKGGREANVIIANGKRGTEIAITLKGS